MTFAVSLHIHLHKTVITASSLSPWQILVPELRYAFSDIHLSGNLSTFNIDFGSCSLTTCVGADARIAEMDAFRSDLLCLFITTLMFSRYGLSRSPMRSLSIQNLQSRSEHHITYSPGFSNLLGNLKTLELSILTVEHECTRSNERPMSMASWDFYTMLPQVWLTPAKILTTLRLSADSHWGYYPKADFRNISFEHLQTLVLDHFTFSHDWQRAWLLRHSMTLTHLVFSRCSILQDVWFKGNLDGDGYPTGLQREMLPGEVTTYNYHTGWSDYLNTMSDSLTRLRSFSLIDEDSKVVVANEVATVLHADRYLGFDFGYYIAVANHDTLEETDEETEDPNSQLPHSMITGHGPQMRERRLALARQYVEDERALRGLLDKVIQRNMRMGSRC